jgi:hypothetical protein
MKKAKSTTPEEINLDKIRRFTKNELEKLSHSAMPFCYQVGHDVLVGNHKVVKIDDKIWEVYHNKTRMFDFYSRKDAIFYCIAMHKKQFSLANNIKDNDILLGRLEFEAILYRKRYKQANEISDDWSSDYFSMKYTETMYKIKSTKEELRKHLVTAQNI